MVAGAVVSVVSVVAAVVAVDVATCDVAAGSVDGSELAELDVVGLAVEVSLVELEVALVLTSGSNGHAATTTTRGRVKRERIGGAYTPSGRVACAAGGSATSPSAKKAGDSAIRA